MFINTLITGDKFSRHNRGMFSQPIRMQLAEKAKTFC